MKRAMFGILLFSVITIFTFLLLDRMFHFSEGMAVLLAIGLGLLVEWLVMHKRKT